MDEEENKKIDTRSDEIPSIESRVFYKSDFSSRKPTVVKDRND